MDLAAARLGADSFVRGNEQHESGTFPFSGSVAGARRKHRGRIVRFIHLGRRTVLHQAGDGFSAGRLEARAFGKKFQELVSGSTEFHLLTPGIRTSYSSAIAGRKKMTP